ncbi:AMP-binding protein [Methylobacter sp. YRD-M1]|uniref:AMP-binding protein n=1 Tax=Methylobacter sp. YRD-M1 TaxID=2911520 RepID=UPI00227C602C|nr:AMP-binding protein [Methylobacter sp. YRD-M1]WAK03777.1 AMP-binding protein [Methylobacter sp. YRD-M1]
MDDLRAHLAETLPEYMVPAAFVHLEALPLTANGKLDRKALPAPEGDAYAACSYEAPEGETEQTLAAIWQDILGIERIGRHDNFFELGGHSLLAVTLIARMRQAGLHADVRTLFTTPTLVGLAALADNGNPDDNLVIPANGIPSDCTAITPEMLTLVELDQAQIDYIVETVPGGAPNVQDIYPLAPLQEGILFHHLLESEGDAYQEPIVMAFDTRERLDSFLTALQAVVDRHDILRTAVVWEGLPEPVQVVWREARLAVENFVVDPEAGEAAEQLLERYDPRHYRIDVKVAPLIDGFTAYDPKENRWLLLLLSHHLALDHTALDILLEEIQMHQLGQADLLPVPLPFRNFVAQARLGISREEHEAFFRGMLGDIDEPTAPFGLLDVMGDGSRVQDASQIVASDLARRVREQARTLGISAASLFHLAWATVVSRTSGRDDVVFGTVLFGRMQGGEGADRVLGLFINTLPLRVQLAQGSVLEQARDVQLRLAGLLRHEHAPLSLAQRCSAVQAPAPLFSSLLNYRYSHTDATVDSTPAWQGIEVLSGEERTNYPIVLSVDDLGEEFLLIAQTLPPVAPERLCAMMHTALENLLTALENAPDTAMRQIDVLPGTERQRVLYDWNATQADYPRDRCLHELFEAQARNTPDAPAVVHDGRTLSYDELNTRANRLAHHLRSLGVGPEAQVALCLERSPELVVGLLAVLKTGAAYVPLDPAYPEDRLAYMLEDSAPLALLTDSGIKARLTERSGGTALIDLVADAAQWAHQSDINIDPSSLGLTPAHLAYVIYTSGSTGQPKGVMVPHAGVMNLVCWHNRQFQVTAADRATQLAGLAFDASAWETWPYLLAGACLHLVRPECLGQPEVLWQQLADERITLAFMPTPLAELMLASPRPEHLALRCLLTGGDQLHGYPPAGLPFEVINNYGPTENSVVSTSCSVPAGEKDCHRSANPSPTPAFTCWTKASRPSRSA